MLRPDPETLRALVEGEVIRGQTLRQWFTRLEQTRFNRLESAVRLGLIAPKPRTNGDSRPHGVCSWV